MKPGDPAVGRDLARELQPVDAEQRAAICACDEPAAIGGLAVLGDARFLWAGIVEEAGELLFGALIEGGDLRRPAVERRRRERLRRAGTGETERRGKRGDARAIYGSGQRETPYGQKSQLRSPEHAGLNIPLAAPPGFHDTVNREAAHERRYPVLCLPLDSGLRRNDGVMIGFGARHALLRSVRIGLSDGRKAHFRRGMT
jgi:hypothetical protein